MQPRHKSLVALQQTPAIFIFCSCSFCGVKRNALSEYCAFPFQEGKKAACCRYKHSLICGHPVQDHVCGNCLRNVFSRHPEVFCSSMTHWCLRQPSTVTQVVGDRLRLRCYVTEFLAGAGLKSPK